MPSMGFDCSNYGGRPTPAQAAQIKAAGYDFAIVGTQQESIARAQIEAFLAAGIRCETYLYPHYDGGDVARVERAVRICRDYGLTRVWDDIEWSAAEGPQPSSAVVNAGLGARLAQVRAAGLLAGIYTSETQWPSMTGGLLDHVILEADTPLWTAYYFFDGHVPDFASFRPYGPWPKPLIWQYHDTTPLAGFTVDLNVWNPAGSVVVTPPAAPPTTPTIERTLQALGAAYATTWVYQSTDRVPPQDLAVIRQVFG